MPALTKITLENLPASMPPGTVEEIVRTIEARDRITWTTGIGYGVISLAAIAVTIATPIMGWAIWVPGAAMAGASGASALLSAFANRQIHRALVAEGHSCPHCRRGMFTDTWSTKEQERQRVAISSGVCPRCAMALGPDKEDVNAGSRQNE